METNNEKVIRLLIEKYRGETPQTKAILREFFRGIPKIIEKFNAIDVEEKK